MAAYVNKHKPDGKMSAARLRKDLYSILLEQRTVTRSTCSLYSSFCFKVKLFSPASSKKTDNCVFQTANIILPVSFKFVGILACCTAIQANKIFRLRLNLRADNFQKITEKARIRQRVCKKYNLHLISILPRNNRISPLKFNRLNLLLSKKTVCCL